MMATISLGFAVMLSFNSASSCSNTLWIVSLSIFAFFIVFSFVFIQAVDRIMFLRRAFYGYANRARSLTSIEAKLVEKKRTTQRI